MLQLQLSLERKERRPGNEDQSRAIRQGASKGGSVTTQSIVGGLKDVRAEKARFKGQADEILSLLKLKPRSNVELAEIALKYTSRISDLRHRGATILCERIGSGLTLYTLKAA